MKKRIVKLVAMLLALTMVFAQSPGMLASAAEQTDVAIFAGCFHDCCHVDVTQAFDNETLMHDDEEGHMNCWTCKDDLYPIGSPTTKYRSSAIFRPGCASPTCDFEVRHNEYTCLTYRCTNPKCFNVGFTFCIDTPTGGFVWICSPW